MNKAHMMDHNQTALQTAQRRHRILWLSGAAFGAAIAANALFMSSASAQALKGGFNPVGPGSATIVRTSTPTGLKDTITINQPTAVINWTPTDTAANAAAINFLGANDSVEFRGDSAFTVLNRIIPVSTAASRRIALNGSVTGSVGGVVGAAGANVWFYTPNGFLIGSTAQFNIFSSVFVTGA